MKVSSIKICGMHKVQDKTYDLNPGTTYFVGPNGSGKSTILEAIQLALLGYIPGYAKTKEGIMKHASGKFMEVELTLDSGIVIDRTWMKSGSGSVTSECNVKGYEGEITDLLKGIELPIFDFNEFTSLTANKLKEWFISFLPSSAEKLDLPKILQDEIKDRQLPSDELLEEVKKWIENSGLTGIDLIKGLNAYLKEDQSFIKGQISKLQGTIESLIHYDDAPDENKEQLELKRKELTELKTKILQSQAAHQSWEKMSAQLKALQDQLPAESYMTDLRVKDLDEKIIELKKVEEVKRADYEEIDQQIREMKTKLNMFPKLANECPYTREECEKIMKLSASNDAEREKLLKDISDLQGEVKDIPADLNQIAAEIRSAQNELNAIQGRYTQLDMLRGQVGPEPSIENGKSVAEIDDEINKIQDGLIKIAANERYDQLTETVTKDKFAAENNLEILKAWIKLTDANGLQTTVMDEPFRDLSVDMSRYLTQMFASETKAEFNLATKANSFSFGLHRNEKYIEFDCLSSGERCLFTLSLMMCILDRSESEIRTIMIDDLLDHLDGTNADSLFESLQDVENIQFILAGVKECGESAICKQV